MKNIIIILIILALIGIGAYFFFVDMPTTDVGNPDQSATTTTDTLNDPDENPSESVIGQSVEGRDIKARHFGTGDKELLLVGGIHGGYSWNTALVAFEAIDYFSANPDAVPENVKVTIVPVLNPDGLYKVAGTADRFTRADIPSSQTETIPGRFNSNDVDLNRNFDCDWKTTGTWQNRNVSGGDSAFSEPEARAIRSYVETNNPEAVVVWYSAAGGVFASNCHGGVSEDTKELTNVYATASGYRAYNEFNFYEITGDMVNWLAKIGTPGISVLLTNHSDIEWSKNQAGIEAILSHLAE